MPIMLLSYKLDHIENKFNYIIIVDESDNVKNGDEEIKKKMIKKRVLSYGVWWGFHVMMKLVM